MSEKIKLGIIGVGNMGSSHAKNIVGGECPDFELVAVADIKPQRLEWQKVSCRPIFIALKQQKKCLTAGL